MKDEAKLKETLALLEEIDRRKTYRIFDYFEPYAKQKQFFQLGKDKLERLLTAGNQQGKTHAGAFEVACHLTGLYPSWFGGKRFPGPTRGWVCGETAQVVRDTQQRKLCGEPGVEELWGTGMIPKELFVGEAQVRGRNVGEALDTLKVRHKNGGISIARFKSYDQGRTKFQGETLEWAWLDEECPPDIYSEVLARVTATRGIVFSTFTSMKGDTLVTDRFVKEDHVDRAYVKMGLRDALHIPPEEYQRQIEKFLPHERDARIWGGIMRGEGRVFLTPEEQITEDPLEFIPPHWVKIWGIDFGIGHPFAAALLLWDRDGDGAGDCIHVHHVYRIKDAISLVHCDHIRRVAGAAPVAWPRDGTERDMHSGEPIASSYRKHGIHMLPEHATWPDGGVSTYAGIHEMDERMKTGRLKVARQLHEFFEEYRDYHYKDNKIVKMHDDILSAVRIGLMMKRYARAVHLGVPPRAPAAGMPMMARNIEFDVFAE